MEADDIIQWTCVRWNGWANHQWRPYSTENRTEKIL